MNKVIYLVIAIFLVICGFVVFQNRTDSTSATTNVALSYKEGDIIAQNSEYYRKFMGKNADNFYVVQDFYSGFDTKLTNPFILTNVDRSLW